MSQETRQVRGGSETVSYTHLDVYKRQELFYTGNIKYEGDYDYVNTGRESNTIYTASKDGRKFGEKECLMSLKDYPKGYTAHIRDPKVWKEKGRYYMVLGGRKATDQGAVILYASDDKKAWRFQEEITTREPFGYMWECPDLFEIEGEKILSVCPQAVSYTHLNHIEKETEV